MYRTNIYEPMFNSYVSLYKKIIEDKPTLNLTMFRMSRTLYVPVNKLLRDGKVVNDTISPDFVDSLQNKVIKNLVSVVPYQSNWSKHAKKEYYQLTGESVPYGLDSEIEATANVLSTRRICDWTIKITPDIDRETWNFEGTTTCWIRRFTCAPNSWRTSNNFFTDSRTYAVRVYESPDMARRYPDKGIARCWMIDMGTYWVLMHPKSTRDAITKEAYRQSTFHTTLASLLRCKIEKTNKVVLDKRGTWDRNSIRVLAKKERDFPKEDVTIELEHWRDYD